MTGMEPWQEKKGVFEDDYEPQVGEKFYWGYRKHGRGWSILTYYLSELL